MWLHHIALTLNGLIANWYRHGGLDNAERLYASMPTAWSGDDKRAVADALHALYNATAQAGIEATRREKRTQPE